MKVAEINSLNRNSTSFNGLVGAKYLEDLVSSEFYHYSREGQLYYPFLDETKEDIDAFVKSNSNIWSSEVLGETTSAETVIYPVSRLNITKSQYLDYKSAYKYGVIFDESYHLVDEELKNRGLLGYMNEQPKIEKKSVFKSIAKFVKNCLRKIKVR